MPVFQEEEQRVKKYIYILESKKQLTLNYHAWEVNPPLNNKMKIKPAATTL